MKTYPTVTFEVYDQTHHNTIARGEFQVEQDTNYHPSILAGELKDKARQLALTFWSGSPVTCNISAGSYGTISYTHDEQ